MKFLLNLAAIMSAMTMLAFSANAQEQESTDIFKEVVLPDGTLEIYYNGEKDGTIYSVSIINDQDVLPGREMMILSIPGRSKATLKIGKTGKVTEIGAGVQNAKKVSKGALLVKLRQVNYFHDSVTTSQTGKIQTLPTFVTMGQNLWKSTGLYDIIRETGEDFAKTWQLGIGRILMIFIGILLLYLAVFKDFEPLLLIPIGFGAILANIPVAGIAGPDGLLGMIYTVGVVSGVFPLLIFMGVGAMTDFGPMIANPKTALLGAGAQFGIFGALLGALVLTKMNIGIDFSLKDAASIGIIGGADGPTAIYLTTKLSPHLLGAIAVAAYSYMALVPIIQPPIMKLLTSKADRKIKMTQLRHVTKLEKICFPVIITLLCALLLPDAAPLIGMLMFGNFMRECGVVERLSSTAQNALINIVTIFLGLAVGSKLSADKFLNMQTLGILVLGCIAFIVSTASGVLLAQLMKVLSGGKINPLIGSAGVSAVPMAARVANKVGLESDPHNFLLMHAMGPNVSGVIGSAVAAGVLLNALSNL